MIDSMVIGVFDNRQEAEAAFNELTGNGFSHAEVQLAPDSDYEEAREKVMHTEDTQSGLNLGQTFHALFGDDSTGHGEFCQEAIRRGAHVVTVNTGSRDRQAQAEEILARFNPVDIGERCDQWRSEGWTGFDPVTGAEVQAYRSHWQSSYAGKGGRYEDFEPAYRYGASLRNDRRYRGYEWTRLEPQARQDWESRNPDASWDEAQQAIRHGWERPRE